MINQTIPQDVTEKTKMNFEKLGGSGLKLESSIKSVTIEKGHVDTDPSIWRIEFVDGIIELDAKKLTAYRPFAQEYIKKFNRPAPIISSEEWRAILEILAEKADVVQATEESENVFIANQVMEKIQRMKIIDDKELAAAGKGLLDHEGYLCLVTTKVEEIIDGRYRIPLSTLSYVMTQLGYKTEGTHKIRCGNGKRPRFWCFFKDIVGAN